MRHKLVTLLLSVAVIVSLVFIGCAPEAAPPEEEEEVAPPAAAEVEVIHWVGVATNLWGPNPNPSRFPTKYYGSGYEGIYFADWIKEVSGGRLIIDMNPPNSIVPVRDNFTAVSKGTIDFCAHYSGYNLALIPECNIEIGLPFAWQNEFEVWDALNNWGLKEEFEVIYAEHNIWPVIHPGAITYGLGMVGDASTPDCIKGKKIRCSGIYGELVEALGGSPTVIPSAELYMALKLGTVDGVIAGSDYLIDIALREVIDSYVYKPNLSTVALPWLFNLDSLNALPSDIREAILRDADKVAAYFFNAIMHPQNDYGIFSSAKEGYLEAVEWSAEDTAEVRKIAIGLWDEVAAKSERCARLVEIVKAQAREAGKIK